MTTKIWAHRGASLKAPENSLPAFALAVELGADGIELDVQLSKDGVPVVFHDFELARLTGIDARLRDLSLAELKKLNLNQQQHFPELGFVVIPTLAEVFELLLKTKLIINIEIKSGKVIYPQIEEKVLALAAEYDLNERIWYSSFNHYSLVQLRQLQPEAHCGILFDNVLFQPWNYAAKFGMQAIHPHHLMLAIPGYVEASHKAGISVHAWTADQPEDLLRAFRLGVDAIITNTPDIAIKLASQT